jgi:hypothetical protein
VRPSDRWGHNVPMTLKKIRTTALLTLINAAVFGIFFMETCVKVGVAVISHSMERRGAPV